MPKNIIHYSCTVRTSTTVKPRILRRKISVTCTPSRSGRVVTYFCTTSPRGRAAINPATEERAVEATRVRARLDVKPSNVPKRGFAEYDGQTIYHQFSCVFYFL